ncbi:hypothetical protein DSO57_1035365 [Entomophthora muscae]|uniref:Uncharacterized protein n=1 Tax=Entomophthora muscae TaxID=34485 RepID=A0ACC2SZV1_9FUNG|nr:hypothetical protein DSO57_1035365 [Entomophthora muscae]
MDLPKMAQGPLKETIESTSPILTEEKPWKQVKECPNKGAKFDNAFLPLSGEKKNQFLKETGLHKNQNILSSEQAPAATAQTPASPTSAPRQACRQSPPLLASHCPATCLPTQLPARPPCSQRAHCQLPGPTPQPTKTHHDTQPIRKFP